MNRGFIILFAVLLVGFVFGAVMANNVVQLEATIPASDTYLAISVDKTYFSFGNVSKGKDSADNFYVNNTGTEDVLVTASLSGSTNTEFDDYIYLKKYGTSVFMPVREFNMTISKNSSSRLWVNLSLVNYSSPIYRDISYKVNMTIRAVPV
jgi:hypothetical protein